LAEENRQCCQNGTLPAQKNFSKLFNFEKKSKVYFGIGAVFFKKICRHLSETIAKSILKNPAKHFEENIKFKTETPQILPNCNPKVSGKSARIVRHGCEG